MTDPADVCILHHLFFPGEGYVSGAYLAEALGCSGLAIEKRIETLRSLGYWIEARPHEGYRLVHAPDILVSDEIRARLSGNPFADRLVVFRETRSTNDVVLREAECGAPHGFTVFAESQTDGRGRLGRRWFSPANRGLCFSVLFRPSSDSAPPTPQSLTMMAAVAVAWGLDAHLPRPVSIKWPNDLLAGRQKICGILVEAKMEAEGLRHGVIGIGINVNHRQEDFPVELRETATSIYLQRGCEARRADVLVSVMAELNRAGSVPWRELAALWRERCETVGSHICVETAEGVREGVMAGVTDEGHLLLRRPSGLVEELAAGTLL